MSGPCEQLRRRAACGACVAASAQTKEVARLLSVRGTKSPDGKGPRRATGFTSGRCRRSVTAWCHDRYRPVGVPGEAAMETVPARDDSAGPGYDPMRQFSQLAG